MEMFKITMESTWLKRGVKTHYVYYMKAKSIKDVLIYFGLDRVKKVEMV